MKKLIIILIIIFLLPIIAFADIKVLESKTFDREINRGDGKHITKTYYTIDVLCIDGYKWVVYSRGRDIEFKQMMQIAWGSGISSSIYSIPVKCNEKEK